MSKDVAKNVGETFFQKNKLFSLRNKLRNTQQENSNKMKREEKVLKFLKWIKVSKVKF